MAGVPEASGITIIGPDESVVTTPSAGYVPEPPLVELRHSYHM